MRIGVGSGSVLKKVAVSLVWPDDEVHTFTFPSTVPDQPVGEIETKEGACYRASKAKEMFPDGDVWIGIENGIVRESKKENLFKDWRDVACIIVLTKDGRKCEKWSESIAIPSNYMKKCMNEQGIVFTTWSDLKDPHSDLTNGLKPRRIFLRNTLALCKQEMNL